MANHLKTAIYAAKQAGKVLLNWQGRFQVREKGRADLVTEADLAAQQTILRIIQAEYPDHDFLGEEDDPEMIQNPNSDFRWIVDPLDGTTNYVHGLPNFSVSVALENRGTIVAGVVYDPVYDKCFSAAKGQGAFLNDKAIKVSQVKQLSTALVAASFSASVDRNSIEIQRFIEVLIRCQAIRRLGSAALNMAYVAAGQLDGYWAGNVKAWDVAAGIILVQEAGGIVRQIGGSTLQINDPKLVATGTIELQQEIQAAINL